MTKAYKFEDIRADYAKLWARMKVTKVAETDVQAKAVIKFKNRYLGIEAVTGVPWFVIGAIHLREAGLRNGEPDFKACLHNGQRIIGTGKLTTIVPKNRGPFSTFEEAAIDALQDYDGEEWTPERVAYTLEKFNGFGYREYRGIPSPYLWGGTSVQERGKYVSDGVYDPTVMDPQIGGMAVLRRIMELDKTASFEDEPTPSIVPDQEPEPKRAWWDVRGWFS